MTLTLWCDCGWTKPGTFVTLSWLRLLIHELRNHRQDGLWARNGVTRYSQEAQ